MKGRTAESIALPRTIWYMGGKTRVIPEFLDEVLERLVPPGGRVLDLFSGSGVVAAFCARAWKVTANDVQRYAHTIARSLIERPPGGPQAFVRSLDIDRDLLPAYEGNRDALRDLYAEPLAREERLLAAFARDGGAGDGFPDRYRSFLDEPGGLYGGAGKGPVGTGKRRGSLYRKVEPFLAEPAIARLRSDPRLRPARLVAAYYGNVYYGLRQAIEIDSLRAAIDDLPESDATADRKRAHYLSALVHAASVATSGTSHFAQPRQLTKDSEILAMARRRSIDVLETFRRFSEEIAEALEALDPDAGNRCLCARYESLVAEGERGTAWDGEAGADVVYADPPYTSDNYSRFYHVLEAIARYDYPPLERDSRDRPSAGRYPEIGRRFQSGFCRPRAVEGEFERIIEASANAGASLVLSYGSPNGLLLKVYRKRFPGRDPVRLLEDLCRRRYRKVETLRRRLLHSGQGDKNTATDELLVVCEGP